MMFGGPKELRLSPPRCLYPTDTGPRVLGRLGREGWLRVPREARAGGGGAPLAAPPL